MLQRATLVLNIWGPILEVLHDLVHCYWIVQLMLRKCTVKFPLKRYPLLSLWLRFNCRDMGCWFLAAIALFGKQASVSGAGGWAVDSEPVYRIQSIPRRHQGLFCLQSCPLPLSPLPSGWVLPEESCKIEMACVDNTVLKDEIKGIDKMASSAVVQMQNKCQVPIAVPRGLRSAWCEAPTQQNTNIQVLPLDFFFLGTRTVCIP